MAFNKGLVKLTDLPPHLQFNRYIETSYRRPMDISGCLKSLVCYGHNETFNIYSHLLLLTYFLLSYQNYIPIWMPGDLFNIVNLFIILQYTISTLPFVFSIIYHTFMCHHGGVTAYKRVLLLDVFGVWSLATFGEIHVIYVTLFNYESFRTLGILLYLVISMIALCCLMFSHYKTFRSLLFAAQFLLRIAFLIVRYSPYGCGPKYNYNYIMMEFLMMTGFLFNALNIPERWVAGPGVDHVINGHSIMHVVCGLGLLVGRNGFFTDMNWVVTISGHGVKLL